MLNRPAQNKKPATGKTGAGRRFQSVLPLAGGESPHGGSKRVSTKSARPKAGQAPIGDNRKQPLPSGPFASARDKRVAAPHPSRTRVRFEFARRAHQRKITPKLGINLAKRRSQGERGEFEKKVRKSGLLATWTAETGSQTNGTPAEKDARRIACLDPSAPSQQTALALRSG